MWEWWMKKGGTDEWSPVQVEWDGTSIKLANGVAVKGKCPKKDAGTFEQMDSFDGKRLMKSYPSKAFLKHMMEDY